jgi:hypothetical protein
MGKGMGQGKKNETGQRRAEGERKQKRNSDMAVFIEPFLKRRWRRRGGGERIY